LPLSISTAPTDSRTGPLFQQVPVDQRIERFLERCRIIEAQRLGRTGVANIGDRVRGVKKPGTPAASTKLADHSWQPFADMVVGKDRELAAIR